ncbi:fumarate hydratase subunit alpha/L(+)-tartrate dehydratase alpha subunit [Salsuginibacillus halophilus]|uniref:Fumarate hydratase subunit alpha/L(+)-tartrate dehydratase alpha subunit n=1 Tax=Salsuginibacillus halophilus TaxID=517424 RepID=A0A2P8HL42_9BACI|nr:fumarate hydratase [Salsuginibacillus halophilus]PSL46900.1 fumarate hydratase subunit alpha/L(+)-tartrate dehydratase alpha subunit [Salsuginibacillus halophilus]
MEASLNSAEVWEADEQFYKHVEEACKTLYIESLKDLPPDVREALEKAYENEELESGKDILSTLIKTVSTADDESLLICQDTGIPVYFVKIGSNVRFNGVALEEAIRSGTKRATLEHPLRSSIVNTLSRENHGTSTGKQVPVIHYEFVPGNEVELLIVPKGSGSENMSYMKMLTPAEGLKGIKKYVLECVFESGANPCPPTIVGIGLGGSADKCAALAKKAAAREVASPSPDPEVRKLEEELYEKINELGIGAHGLGGNTTALAVQIETADTHMTMNPVAVNLMCWPARRMRAVFQCNEAPEIKY